MILGSWALLIAVFGGVLMGVYAALRQNSWPDYALMAFSALGNTVPNFVIGPILTLIFAVALQLVRPAAGATAALQSRFAGDRAGSAAACGVRPPDARRHDRGLARDHVRTARAYGLPASSVVGRHALRAGLMPVISYLGLRPRRC